MTPDLMEEGARRREAYAKKQAERATESGGRAASFGRILKLGEPDFTQGVALYVDDITVSFDGFKALNALSLTVNVGELRCIIGPNGAGKTTMMDCITGKTRPDAGKVFFGSTIDLLRLTEPADRADRHRPQVPEAHGLRGAERVREPRARAAPPTGARGRRCSPA